MLLVKYFKASLLASKIIYFLISNIEDRLKVAHTGACTEEDLKDHELSRMSSKSIGCEQ